MGTLARPAHLPENVVKRGLVLALLVLVSAGALASGRLALDWREVTIRTDLGDVLHVVNGEQSVEISLAIDGEDFVVDRNLPAPNTLVPGSIGIEYEVAGLDEAGIGQLSRTVVMALAAGPDKRIVTFEYRFLPSRGLCGFSELDASGNSLRHEDYCPDD